MKISVVPSWVHKASAFAVVAVGSAAAWGWSDIVSAHTAAVIVTVLGGAKGVLEFVTRNTTV